MKTISDHSQSEAKFPAQDEVLRWDSKSLYPFPEAGGWGQHAGREASKAWLHSSIAVEDFIKLLCSVSDKRQMKEAKKYTWSVILVILACTLPGWYAGESTRNTLGGSNQEIS